MEKSDFPSKLLPSKGSPITKDVYIDDLPLPSSIFSSVTDVVTRERTETEKEDEWDAKDLKAINVIYSGISNDQLQFIKDKETAYEIVKKFDELYLNESTALQICIRNKLEKLMLKD
ncbi:hypothetical protein QE152_g8049 [Popillia japonica]|uniref:Uncharacterized protein n=1 Tax=Popillia japonica TaxID=7064 RepID=A0AAW1MD31_POPJA